MAVEAEHKNDNINFKDNSDSINTDSDDELISVNDFNSAANPKKMIEAIWVDEAFNILNSKLENNPKQIAKIANSSLDCIRFENINPKLYRRWHFDYKSKMSYNLDHRVLSNDYSPPKIKKKEVELKLVVQKLDYNALISETLNKFQLNVEQIPCFLLFVNKLLNNKPKPQILCNLTGEGGTGKTMLIDALQYFFEKTNNLHKLLLTATTGIAATNINGNTIHSMVALSFYNKHLPHLNISSKNKLELEKRFQNVEFLVIEENSMNGKINLNIISKMLMIAKNNDSIYGGINILFVGDFFQLQPVKQVALFRQSNIEKCSNYNKKFIQSEISKYNSSIINQDFNSEDLIDEENYDDDKQKNVKQNQIDMENGRILWLSLTHCFILTIQMRQISDPIYANLLRRSRYKECTNQDFILLNRFFYFHF